MPMKWDAPANEKLFAAIMQVFEVKFTEAQLQQVAAIMGPECTAKALRHRIGKLKSHTSAGESITTPVKGTPKRTSIVTKKTPTKTPTKSSKRKRAETPSDDDEEMTMPTNLKYDDNDSGSDLPLDPSTPVMNTKLRRSISRSATKPNYAHPTSDDEDELDAAVDGHAKKSGRVTVFGKHVKSELDSDEEVETLDLA